MLAPGDAAPDFKLRSDTGETVRLADLRGSRVVLYFYPKDDTPGCTTQALGLRDVYHEIEATGARLFGVSADSVASHVRFREKYGLPFPLLADPEHEMIAAYGMWVERVRDGKPSMGVERSTVLIDADGRIEHVWRSVKPDEHAEMVLDALTASGARR
jgi:peroxiredoxin Q/BCP